VIEYLFDGATTTGPGSAPVSAFDLTAVQFPDGSIVQYLYGELDRFLVAQSAPMPWTYNVLTRVVDESNTRLSSFTYDHYGIVQRTERADGVYAFSLARSATIDNATRVTDPLGTVREYVFRMSGSDNVMRIRTASEPCPGGGATCVTTVEYDAAGVSVRRTHLVLSN
jgi:hypothetical protein